MTIDWQPACALVQLQLRAQVLKKIRGFFADRAVLEVETPVLSQAIGTDPQLAFFTTHSELLPRQALFLQTSPEFAMKRLLAAGSGCIFQVCKAFRNGEAGRYHNPEFTMLEWYRVGFDLSQLMAEIVDLLDVLGIGRHQPWPCIKMSYQALFFQQTGLDALAFNKREYAAYAQAANLPEAMALCGEDHAMWLDFLFSHCVQPKLTQAIYLVYGYPACQSSLARLNSQDARVTERVELFVNGIELGNGYHELTDMAEQQQRFDKEILLRQKNGQALPVKDQRLLAALQAGLPDCAGMAIGVDRLLMVLAPVSHIDGILSFPIHRA